MRQNSKADAIKGRSLKGSVGDLALAKQTAGARIHPMLYCPALPCPVLSDCAARWCRRIEIPFPT
jgi:hypothetical protein